MHPAPAHPTHKLLPLTRETWTVGSSRLWNVAACMHQLCCLCLCTYQCMVLLSCTISSSTRETSQTRVRAAGMGGPVGRALVRHGAPLAQKSGQGRSHHRRYEQGGATPVPGRGFHRDTAQHPPAAHRRPAPASGYRRQAVAAHGSSEVSQIMASVQHQLEGQGGSGRSLRRSQVSMASV